MRFTEAMDDDFNTPVALAVLFDLSKAINAALDRPEGISDGARKEIDALLDNAGKETLGIFDQNDREFDRESKENTKKIGEIMDILFELRAEARDQKNFILSDKIRDLLLLKSGIEIKDTKEGPVWSETEKG